MSRRVRRRIRHVALWALLGGLAAGPLGPRVSAGGQQIQAGASEDFQQVPPGRDPFGAPAPAPVNERLPGLVGWRVEEVVVQGVARWSRSVPDSPGSKEGGLAILVALSSGEGFVVAPGARLMDGVVSRIGENGVWFLRDVAPDQEFFAALGPPRQEIARSSR